MGKKIKLYQGRNYKYEHEWHEFRAILYLMNRRAELRRLVKWAKRNQLDKPLRLYIYRLKDTDLRLAQFSIRSPQLARKVTVLHFFSSLITTTPKYPRKRLADGYRYRTSN